MRKPWCFFVLAIVGQVLARAQTPQTPPAQQPPAQVPGTFRSTITMVPLDVRVLDRNGKPITDLRQEDFTVLEDTVPQQIRYFSSQALQAEDPGPSTAPAARRALGPDVKPQSQRVFLILLGRGRLQGPSKGVDGAIHFVREQLLPQDRVAVLAFNRATSFTTDHQKVAQVLERFKRSNDSIEGKLSQHFSGLTAVYGSKSIPAPIQAEIDRVFHGDEGLTTRQLPPGRITESGRIADDVRRNVDLIQRRDIIEARAENPSPFDASDLQQAERIDLSFDEYVTANAQTMQDVGNIYTGIEYLRYIEGEKHLVFFTERGIFLPRVEDDRGIAAAASDARVVIDAIHTGGLIGPPPPTGRGSSPLPSTGMMFMQNFSVQSLRTIADLTGGQASAFSFAEKALNRIDDATRAYYLLGYYPANGTWDGKYRRISVRVNRPGVTVLFRHGYFARTELVPFDREKFLSYSRVTAAGHFVEDIRDIPITARLAAEQGGADEIRVEATIDVAKLKFALEDGWHVGAIDVAIFCADARENLVGQTWQKVDLRAREDVYQQMMKTGLPFNARIAIRSQPRYVKVIVYDYGADVLGSAVLKVK